jgi:peptidoglycan/xylan/chitin deacetylase (PgdA/CDA1 family)
MIGRITIKREIKRAAGLAAVAFGRFTAAPRDAACILMYHRTARIDFVDERADDWNVPPDVFERHMRWLAKSAEAIALLDLPRRLLAQSASTRPLVCVTFDDGYGNVCEQALPILVRYGIPATFFVATSFVGMDGPLPFDRWGSLNRRHVRPDTWRAAGWGELECAVATGLVHVGSHSHRHLEGRDCTATELVEEASYSRERIHARLGGEHARAFAYPYGSSRLGDVPAHYEDAVRAAGYEIAVTTDLGLVRRDDNPFRLPRIEAHELDSPAVMRAKLLGSIVPYRVTDRLRSHVH